MSCVGREFKVPPLVARLRPSLSARSSCGLNCDNPGRKPHGGSVGSAVGHLYFACPRCGKGDVPVDTHRGAYVCEVCGEICVRSNLDES